MSTFFRCLALFLLSLASCARVAPARNSADLLRNLEFAAALEIHATSGPLLERCRVVASWGIGREALVSDLTVAGDLERPRIVLGTGETRSVSVLAERVGAKLTKSGFTWEGRVYDGPGDALVFTLEDPDRVGLPLTVYFGNDASQLARYVSDLHPCTTPSLRTYREGRVESVARLSLRGELQRTTLEDRTALRAELLASPRNEIALGEGVVLSVNESLEPQRAGRYAERLTDAVTRAGSWLPSEGGRLPLEVVVLERIEDFTSLFDEPRLFALNRLTGEVNVLLERGAAHDSGAGAALARALQKLGPANAAWLEHGIAVDASNAWWERDLVQWVAHLTRENGPLAIEQLVAPDAAMSKSPHRVRPLQGMLCRYLRELHGNQGLRDVWTGQREFAPRNEEFATWLALQVASAEPLFARTPSAEFMRGVCLLESETARHGTDLETFSLAQIDALNANAISLTSFMTRLPERPDFAAVEREGMLGPVSGDVALAATVAQARRYELRVLLAPQLLTAPSGSWVAEQVGAKDGVSQLAFEQRTGRLVDHFGLLAELCEIEMLSLSNGLDEPARAIAVLRAVFRGALTYSAAWRGEAIEVGFWSELDYVSCSLFASLARGPDDTWTPASEAQIRHLTRGHVTHMLELARTVGRPLLISEIGLPSTSRAWRDPRVAEGGVDLEAQARFVRAVGLALEDVRAESDQLQGVFLWNWWSESLAGGAQDRGYTPQNKPAEQALRGMFSKL